MAPPLLTMVVGIGYGLIPFMLGIALHIYNDAGRWAPGTRPSVAARWKYVRTYLQLHLGTLLLSLALFTAWEAGAFDTIEAFGGALVGKIPHNFLVHIAFGWFSDSVIKAVIFRVRALFPAPPVLPKEGAQP